MIKADLNFQYAVKDVKNNLKGKKDSLIITLKIEKKPLVILRYSVKI